MMWPLDARELKAWLEKYDHAKTSFVSGFISRIEASDALRNLRFRDDALRIELLEWEREKATLQKAKLSNARKRLKDYMHARTTPASSGLGDL